MFIGSHCAVSAIDYSAVLYDKSKRAQVTPEQARKLIGEGDPKAIAKLARERSNADPRSAAWREIIALAHVHQQQFIEEVVQVSIIESRRAVELAPENAQVLGTRALIQFLLKEYPDAIKSAKAALTYEPENRRAKMILLVSKQLEKLEAAKTSKVRSSQVRSKTSDRATSSDRAKSSDAKSSDLSAVSKAPESSTRLKMITEKEEILSVCNSAGTDYDVYATAVRYFRIRLDPDGVKKVFDTWLRNAPVSSYACYRRGQFEEAQRDYLDALSFYERATTLNANYVTPLARLAYCQYKLKRYEEALKTYEKLAARNGMSNAARYLHRAQCYSALGKHDLALKDFNTALETELGNTDPVRQLHEAMKRDPKARKVLRSWLNMRSETYEKLGKIDKALDDAKLGVMVSSGDAAALDFRRKLYERNKQFDLALKDLNLLIQMNKTAAPWYQARAAVLEKLGRRVDAQKDLEQYDSLRKHGTLK